MTDYNTELHWLGRIVLAALIKIGFDQLAAWLFQTHRRRSKPETPEKKDTSYD